MLDADFNILAPALTYLFSVISTCSIGAAIHCHPQWYMRWFTLASLQVQGPEEAKVGATGAQELCLYHCMCSIFSIRKPFEIFIMRPYLAAE